MYGYGSKEPLSLIRMNEFRIIHITNTLINIEIKIQEPPNEATLSAIFWPKVNCSERPLTTFVEIGVLSVI
jgi:hypothetical protein